LTDAGWRVVAMDLPPFGFSHRPASGDYSRSAQARRILAVIGQLRAGSVILLGHSFGGGPAAEAAMQQPGAVTHLVLVDAAIGLQGDSPPPCETPWLAHQILDRPGVRTGLFASAITEPAFSSYWLRKFVARKEVVTAQRTAVYQKPFVVHGFTEGLAAWARQFALGCEFPPSVRPSNFRRLQVPVSLLWGELDDVTPLAQARALQRLLPHATLTVLPGVGHIPQIEDPPAFDRALVEALRAAP
jgi:pimeloyl-ACP methyl ester carboxylesterase